MRYVWTTAVRVHAPRAEGWGKGSAEPARAAKYHEKGEVKPIQTAIFALHIADACENDTTKMLEVKI